MSAAGEVKEVSAVAAAAAVSVAVRAISVMEGGTTTEIETAATLATTAVAVLMLGGDVEV